MIASLNNENILQVQQQEHLFVMEMQSTHTNISIYFEKKAITVEAKLVGYNMLVFIQKYLLLKTDA